MLGEHLIGQIDDAGYLRRDLDSIVNDLAFTEFNGGERGAGEGSKCHSNS